MLGTHRKMKIIEKAENKNWKETFGQREFFPFNLQASDMVYVVDFFIECEEDPENEKKNSKETNFSKSLFWILFHFFLNSNVFNSCGVDDFWTGCLEDSQKW